METKIAKLKLDPEIKLFESMDFDIDNSQGDESNEILEISAVKSESQSESFDFESSLINESNSNASDNQFEFEIGFEDQSTKVQSPLDLNQEQALFPNLIQEDLKLSNTTKKPINNAPEYKPDQNGIYDLEALIAASFVLD